MKKFTKFLLPAMIMILLLAACGVVKGLSDLNKAGDAFMTSLHDGTHDLSYNMLTTAVQNEVGGKDGWVQFATPRNFDSWKFTSSNIQNSQGQLDGQAVIGNETYDMTLVFDLVNQEWKVSGINFTFVK